MSGSSVRVIYPPQPPPLDVSEAAFQRLVVDLAQVCGWVCWHDEDSRRNQAGLPDLLLIRERVLWRELKARRGRVRPAQEVFGRYLVAAGADYAVWRPHDWPAIVATLTAEEGEAHGSTTHGTN